MLVEAKAHEAELDAKCKAENPTSLDTITRRLSETFASFGGEPDQWTRVKALWLGRGYQIANRLACLRFLLENHQQARLVFVCFLGDKVPGKKCPTSPARWCEVLDGVHSSMGLPTKHDLNRQIHYIYPPVVGP